MKLFHSTTLAIIATLGVLLLPASYTFASYEDERKGMNSVAVARTIPQEEVEGKPNIILQKMFYHPDLLETMVSFLTGPEYAWFSQTCTATRNTEPTGTYRIYVSKLSERDGTLPVYLPKLRKIQDLSLYDIIGMIISYPSRCYERVQCLTNLQSLEIKPDSHPPFLLRYLPRSDKLKTLILRNNSNTDEELVHLGNVPEVETLNLAGNPSITDVGLASLMGLSKLTSLNLTGDHITDEGLRVIGTLMQLRVLHIFGLQGPTKITAVGIGYLTALENLEELDAGYNSLASDSFVALLGLPNLKSLGLSLCHTLTEADLHPIGDLTQLVSLDLRYNPALTRKIFQYLGGLTNLQNLEVYGTKISQDEVLHFLNDRRNIDVEERALSSQREGPVA